MPFSKKRKGSMGPFLLMGIGLLLITFSIWEMLLRPSLGRSTATASAAAPVSRLTGINLGDAREAYNRGNVLFLDVCKSNPASSGSHIPGTMVIPADHLESRLDELNPNQWIITYCTQTVEESSKRAARFLLSKGFKKVTPLLGNFDAWKEAGYPIEP